MRLSRSVVAFVPWPRSTLVHFVVNSKRTASPFHNSCRACRPPTTTRTTRSDDPQTDEYGIGSSSSSASPSSKRRAPLSQLTRHGLIVGPEMGQSMVAFASLFFYPRLMIEICIIAETLTPKLKRQTRAKTPELSSAKSSSTTNDEGLGSALDESDVQTMTRLEESIRIDRAKYPDAILLTQVGSFFESYFDQAPMVAKLLNIKLTSKVFGKKGNKIRHAFAGFPLAQLSKHATTLIEAGHKVVVVEETKQVGGGGSGMYDENGATTVRRVTRVITPGTGIDEAFVQVENLAYVLAIGVHGRDDHGGGYQIGMAYRDVSTGSSFTRTSTLQSLRDDLLLVQPKEVVVDFELSSTPFGQAILDILQGEQRRENLMISTVSTSSILQDPSCSTSKYGQRVELIAEDVLLAYLAETLVSSTPPPIESTFIDPSLLAQMDSTTLKSLEVRESLRGGTKGSLFAAVKRTSTPSGTRLLLERLCAPSTERKVIEQRAGLVETFVRLGSTRKYAMALFKTFDDLPRILQKLVLAKKGAQHSFELLALKKVVVGVQEIRAILEDHLDSDEMKERQVVEGVLARLHRHEGLAMAIERAIDEEALHERHEQALRTNELIESYGTGAVEKILAQEQERHALAEGEGDGDEGGSSKAASREGLWGKDEPWVIRPHCSPALQKLHQRLRALRQAADQLETRLIQQHQLNPTKLTLRVLPKYGPIVHVVTSKPTPIDLPDSGFSSVLKSGSTRSYAYSEWTAIHVKLLKVTAEIQKLESETVKVLVARVAENYKSLKETAEAIAELDVAMGFAEVADEMKWVRPRIDESTRLHIIDGRHPTVEQALQVQHRGFTTNSVLFDHPDAFVHVITGPNMAGKSTYLRQNALIVLLAQVGSFVPTAPNTSIGLVDRIFSRVGARDELDRDRSTFMIEMDEASSILHTATSRSFVLLDELGRGTSPLDGLSIAFGALEHLVHVNACRTLFATHYHRLGELMGYDERTQGVDPDGVWKGVEFWCTRLEEQGNSVTYLHDVRKGLNDDSGGLTVARLSGMPERAIETAMRLRDRYRK
ncbi:BQ2448_2915 [Microbotryum intermedium]|uniref:BQ2448_2915 protein n=1 Tax=Microbotryum intermedium TaxID=269621 RepID=A0A238FDQ9_9BASI|nr:BQ2448_2915 [Microbotryum intermedium]